MEYLLMTSVGNFIIWNDVEVKFTLETSGGSNVRTPTVSGSGELLCARANHHKFLSIITQSTKTKQKYAIL
jgi:hypothetical protein